MKNQHNDVEDDDLHEAAIPLNADVNVSVKTRKDPLSTRSSKNNTKESPSKPQRHNKQETGTGHSEPDIVAQIESTSK